jgi:enoyl-CoA hydratase/carnithine racemase
MSLIETRTVGDVIELKMARPPVNALNGALLTDLLEALRTAASGPARAIVLSGRPGLFSAGLDIPELLAKDPAAMMAFWRLFFDVQRQLAGSPVPIVAAITGHSPAGGAVLAMYCDYRVMAQGKYGIGLNEVAVGLYAGPVIHAVLRRVVGPRRAELLLSTGRLMSPDEALAFGFVDELAPEPDVVARAFEWAQQTARLPQMAQAATRTLARSDLMDLVRDAGLDERDTPARLWFSPETQATLKALVERLKKK